MKKMDSRVGIKESALTLQPSPFATPRYCSALARHVVDVAELQRLGGYAVSWN